MTSSKRRGCVWRIYTYPCVPQHLTPHAPKQALDPLHTSRIQPPSVAWIRARCHGELTPALRTPQATTKRDFGAAGSLMRQNDRVVAPCCCTLSGQLSIMFTEARTVCVDR